MKHFSILTAVAISLVSAVSLTGAVSQPSLSTGARPAYPPPDGKAIYAKNCKQCHGVLGEATKVAKAKYDKIPSLQDPELYTKHSDEDLLEVMSKGKGEMKGFAEKLSKEEMVAVLEYVHTLHKKG